jgi:ComF family protein
LCARPPGAAPACERCRAAPPPWSRAIVPLAWRFPVDALIGRFKYAGALHYGAMLGRLLGRHCRGRDIDGLVPVPLHPGRLRERGFNQADELARAAAPLAGVPVLRGACRRVAATVPQAGLGARERYRNLAGAFAAAGSLEGRRLAIVDDVLTTGSTAAAVAEALLQAGAHRVEVWAVARGGTAQDAVKV